MAKWTKQYTTPENINNGNEFSQENGDVFDQNSLNGFINNSFYVVDKVNTLLEPIDNSEANNVGIAKIEITPNGNLKVYNIKGEKGEKGEPNTLTIGSVTSGDTASATITGNTPNQVLNLVLQKGEKGEKGEPNTLTIGSVTSGDTASATITGNTPNQVLNLVLPVGDAAGFAEPQVTTETVSSNEPANVTITTSGDNKNKQFDFHFQIPKGEKGDSETTVIKSADIWEIENPILNVGQFGYDTTNKITKIGDGISNWNNLGEFVIKQFIPPKFEDASWDEIDIISKSGYAHKYFKIGDEKIIELTSGEIIKVQIIGFNHDNLSDKSGKAGITIGLKNSLETKYIMNPTKYSGGWKESQIRNETLNNIYELLPTYLQNVIKNVDKITAIPLSQELEITSDKLFLLSLFEIMGTNNYKLGNNPYTILGEGTQYEYYRNSIIPAPKPNNDNYNEFSILENTSCFYQNKSSISSYYYKNKFNEEKKVTYQYYYNYNATKGLGYNAITSYNWWTRSPMKNSEYSVIFISNLSNIMEASSYASNGLSFAFCV